MASVNTSTSKSNKIVIPTFIYKDVKMEQSENDYLLYHNPFNHDETFIKIFNSENMPEYTEFCRDITLMYSNEDLNIGPIINIKFDTGKTLMLATFTFNSNRMDYLNLKEFFMERNMNAKSFVMNYIKSNFRNRLDNNICSKEFINAVIQSGSWDFESSTKLPEHLTENYFEIICSNFKEEFRARLFKAKREE